ncbi:hypothetical protein ACSS6W_000666 [Trichoderma asperelloides]
MVFNRMRPGFQKKESPDEDITPEVVKKLLPAIDDHNKSFYILSKSLKPIIVQKLKD